MVYERIKKISGKEYRYLVTGKRINGKVVQKVVKYLGPKDPIYNKKVLRPRLFVRDLNKDERDYLYNCKKNTDAFTRDRAKCILLSQKKKSCNEIAKKLDFDIRKVRSAINRFNKEGTSSLKRKTSPGKPPKITKEQRTKILELIATEPQKLGLHYTSWSLPKLQKYLIEHNIIDAICIESIRNILYSSGTRLKRSKKWQYSNDPDFQKKTSN